MKNLGKLKLEEFNGFNLSISNLKSLTGGGTATQRNIPGHSTNGPDFIDDCTDMTAFADGSEDKDTIE